MNKDPDFFAYGKQKKIAEIFIFLDFSFLNFRRIDRQTFLEIFNACEAFIMSISWLDSKVMYTTE